MVAVVNQLTALKSLTLEIADPPAIQVFVDILVAMPGLQHFEIIDSGFKADVSGISLASLQYLRHLKCLKLDKKMEVQGGAGGVGAHTPHLTELQVCPSGWQSLSLLSRIAGLRSLALHGRYLEPRTLTVGQEFGHVLESLSHLTCLSIQDLQIGPDLGLKNNSFSGLVCCTICGTSGLESLPLSLVQLQSLERLCIGELHPRSSNTGELDMQDFLNPLDELPQGAVFPGLKRLSLVDVELDTFPSFVTKISGLTFFQFGPVTQRGVQFTSLPDNFTNLRQLRHLHFSYVRGLKLDVRTLLALLALTTLQVTNCSNLRIYCRIGGDHEHFEAMRALQRHRRLVNFMLTGSSISC